ncbi:hypothetical protein GM661_17830 [Iocasia frigidifontis]|uniref:Uncharacterized protein n=1 Tax=Iocasia fonsfrigidae TaxID=2682810 RepID=A0A8A7KEJ9_9FIRM|nr:hypothetical protein [Iocasia fonsfrigidae]QTL99680.1 hypothetical protein GM661_17830 [Iocasia fonsfrigidae]
MADEIKQLIDMLARLRGIVEDGFATIEKRFEDIDRRFEAVGKRFDNIEVAIQELNTNQLRILNSMKLLERDVKSNQKHIERLEEKESFL